MEQTTWATLNAWTPPIPTADGFNEPTEYTADHESDQCACQPPNYQREHRLPAGIRAFWQAAFCHAIVQSSFGLGDSVPGADIFTNLPPTPKKPVKLNEFAGPSGASITHSGRR